MEGNDNSRTPLSPSAREALDELAPVIEETDDHLSREEARSHLHQIDFDAELARTTLDELLNKGYLYDVHGELRLP
ncbi:hypothetical protein [Haladaptatus halobius]|jgi:hypothetical protein|uniref:hypothetical protein n=1 Tax=Haladaptatus halobius TaxID=2884875 RepID=UPI001D0AA6E4|nr:hypothetical protein [Haladaptatus halobius]